jgi:hypothetical protein
MYKIIKTVNGQNGIPIMQYPYNSFEDAQIELIDSLQTLCEEKGVYEDSVNLPFLLEDLQDYLKKSKNENFNSFSYDNYKLEIVKIYIIN